MNGPGHHAKRLLSLVGINPDVAGCQCNVHAAEMDCRGTLWCRAHRDTTIREWMRLEAKRRKIPFNGLATSMLIERSIRLAERDGWHADDRSCLQPTPHPSVVCGMTTAKRHNPTLLASVRSLAAAGYATSVFAEPESPQLDLLPDWCEVVQRDHRYGAWHNWKAMATELWQRATDTGAEYVATFQDDIQCSPHLRTMVESFPFDERRGCLLLYTPAHYYHWEKPDHGWRLVTTRSLWGLLGIVIRRDELRKVLDSKPAQSWLGAWRQRPDETRDEYLERVRRIKAKHRQHPHFIQNVDTAFGQSVRTKMHCHLPSLIRHTATHSSIAHGGNSGNRNSASLLLELPPLEKRTVIPTATKKPDNGEPPQEKTNGVVIHKDTPPKSPVRKYHNVARKRVSSWKPGALLDVGSGIQKGVDWLKAIPHFKRVSLELENQRRKLPGVEMHFGDFMQWGDGRTFDYVVCMQVLEHVADPVAFCERLFSTAQKRVLISIPYQWPPDDTGEHERHHLDESHLREWTGRDPVWSQIVKEPKGTKGGKMIRRLVAEYSIDGQLRTLSR